MSDYFDELGAGLQEAVRRRAHLPWHSRLRQLSLRHRGLAVMLASLVVATPAVAAVGAVAGWFSKGKPDAFYRGSPDAGLGKPVSGTRMLPITVADPDGGPPWGLRLVKTSRGDTCVQVGRVEDGTLVSLGIDDSWGNDHKFHVISPNDGVFDICGATDGAGHGFVSSQAHGDAASAFMPSDSGSGVSARYCQPTNPASRLEDRLKQLRKGSRAWKAFNAFVKRVEDDQKHLKVKLCPAGSLRMISVGLLGPDAKSITYRTPSGTPRTEDTVGGVGAYLIVFKQTAANCNAFTTTLDSSYGGGGCQSGYSEYTDLQGPNAVISVTYADGKTCSDVPSRAFSAAYKAFQQKIRREEQHKPATWIRRQFAAFMTSQHMAKTNLFTAVDPHCAPVGWVNASEPKISSSAVRAPLRVKITEGRRFCVKGRWSSIQDNTIVCDGRVPKGYSSYWESSEGANGPLFALVRVSFVAREAVTSTNSFYEWDINNPGNNGGGGGRTQADVRKGERITFTMSLPIPGTGGEERAPSGIYRGTVGFIENVGKAGPGTGGDNPGHDGSRTVGRFSFKLPLKH